MFVTLAIICFCFFILSFSLLFRKQLGKFFCSIIRFFKRLFYKKNKVKQERLKANKSQIVPKMIGGSTQKRIDAPNSPFTFKSVSPFIKEDDIKDPFIKINKGNSLKNVMENDGNGDKAKVIGNKFSLSLEEIEKRNRMTKQRSNLDEELKNISKSLHLDEEELDKKIKMFEKEKFAKIHRKKN